MKQPVNFETYILFNARRGKNEARAECLEWLRDLARGGLFPDMQINSSLARWKEFYLLMPREHVKAAGNLWREYMTYRAEFKRTRGWTKPRGWKKKFRVERVIPR